MFEIIFLAAVAAYFIQTVIFITGLNKSFPKCGDDDLLPVSIIVAARNEEDNIYECLEALNNLQYPEGKIEIIIADDSSDDKTGEIISKYIEGKEKFKSFIPVPGSLIGKANAIDQAVAMAEGELILTTDADCTPNPKWAKTAASYFTGNVGMVSGYTTQRNNNLFEAMQAVDFIYLLSVAGGVMNLNNPMSCIGNNMAYRKSVYNELGGYNNLEFSVTEDFALLKGINKLGKYRIIHPADPELLVLSKPCSKLKSLYRQKKRWGVGGLQSDVSGFAVMAVAWLAHLCFILLPFFFSASAFYIFLYKILIDYYFLKPVYQKLNLKLNTKHFLVFEIYFVIYVFVLPFIVFTNRKIIWKGREY